MKGLPGRPPISHAPNSAAISRPERPDSVLGQTSPNVLGARDTYRRKFTGNVTSCDFTLNQWFAVVQFFRKVLTHISRAANLYLVFRSRY